MTELVCACSKKYHSSPLDGFLISSGAVIEMPQFLKNFNNIFIVADERTYKAAGNEVEKILKADKKSVNSFILDGEVLPDSKTIGEILLHAHNPSGISNVFEYSPLPDIILAVGSGTINDCCRFVSYRLNIPYAVIATAPSMDGYFSAGSPLIFDKTKKTVQCTTPRFVIADLDILSAAPYTMLLAGIGDMLGKYTGIFDWELARDVKGEYFCETIAGNVLRATDNCLIIAQSIEEKRVESISEIMKGFLVSGLGMVYTGNSRPASGSEHIIAHAWELEDIEKGIMPPLHGLLVCEATRLVSIILQMLFDNTEDQLIKDLINKYIPFFKETSVVCKKINIQSPIKDRNRIIRGIKRALTLRDRYTILFYLRDCRMLDFYAEKAADELIREIE